MSQYFTQQLIDNPVFSQADIQEIVVAQTAELQAANETQENSQLTIASITEFLTQQIGKKRVKFIITMDADPDSTEPSFIDEVTCFEDQIDSYLSPLEYVNEDLVKGIPVFKIVNKPLFDQIYGTPAIITIATTPEAAV